jgi:hypothetical protein
MEVGQEIEAGVAERIVREVGVPQAEAVHKDPEHAVHREMVAPFDAAGAVA